jgi:hypothetical protein
MLPLLFDGVAYGMLLWRTSLGRGSRGARVQQSKSSFSRRPTEHEHWTEQDD